MPRKRMDALLSALVAKWPPQGPWPTADRVNNLRQIVLAFNSVYGVGEEISVTIGASAVERLAAPTNLRTSDIPAAPSGPKLYVIKEDGQAYCDGLPMALKDLPATVTFTDKRGPFAEAQFAWESILWSDVGAVAPGTAFPPGLTLVPRATGMKLRSVSGGEADAEISS